jgi:ribosomal protein L40E
MDDLFDEAGFSSKVEAVCPMCRAEMAGNAVLCTKCGYHKEVGMRLQGHKTAGVDIDHGTLALQKAALDMVSDKAMQEKLIAGGGMPWWALALVLFVISSALTIAVLAVNASRRVDAAAPANPMALFLVLTGFAFYAVAQGAFIMIVVHAFKQSVVKGLLTLFIPFYALYHVAKNWKETWKYLVAAIVLGGIAGALFGAAAAQGGV